MATATRMPNRAARRLESIEHAADYLGVSTKTIRRRIADGTITGYRTGPRLLRVDLNELEDRLLRPVPTAGGQRAS
ncbi:helix-turn-helix transcriptional regulator [Nocardioides caldifontis]|uniref:helix-turn-helix transcriptional regulator n=1 Tax=Nocardioides caldifontis TaxID=2588938 RepID=UPI00193AD3FE|nr:helix-turn-helix domain-containing protein [Nocardioides caldifontis]